MRCLPLCIASQYPFLSGMGRAQTLQACAHESSRLVLNCCPAQPLHSRRVNISVAIMPMAKDYGWSPSVSGIIQSAFFYGYMLTQIPGGYVTARLGGRRVLPAGVSLWSIATAGVPLLAGTLPGTSTPSLPRLSRASGSAGCGEHCQHPPSCGAPAPTRSHALAADYPCIKPGGLLSLRTPQTLTLTQV